MIKDNQKRKKQTFFGKIRSNICSFKMGFYRPQNDQTACLVVNPVKVNSFAYLFNCTTVGRASD